VLSQRGLVVTRHGTGTFVAEPSGEQTRAALRLLLEMRQVDLVELCDARLLVEPQLAALAASRARVFGANDVTAAYVVLEASRADPEEHVRADLAFHAAIAELSGHTVLKAIVDAVREPVTRGMILGTSTPGAMEHSDEQHEAILSAIVAGDAEAAREAMREHLAYVRHTLASLAGTKERA
jgi:DNA-binding FadR family transcriptional regulator